jgi:hypothetical protein
VQAVLRELELALYEGDLDVESGPIMVAHLENLRLDAASSTLQHQVGARDGMSPRAGQRR